MKLKYTRTEKWFKLPDGREVQSFNAEEATSKKDVSWSHGFTHLRDHRGNVSFCGQGWFEENAVEI